MTMSSSTVIEAPSRDELVKIFARRFPNSSLQEVGELFDDYLILATSTCAPTS